MAARTHLFQKCPARMLLIVRTDKVVIRFPGITSKDCSIAWQSTITIVKNAKKCLYGNSGSCILNYLRLLHTVVGCLLLTVPGRYTDAHCPPSRIGSKFGYTNRMAIDAIHCESVPAIWYHSGART
jgi:hypothetical protein